LQKEKRLQYGNLINNIDTPSYVSEHQERRVLLSFLGLKRLMFEDRGVESSGGKQ